MPAEPAEWGSGPDKQFSRGEPMKDMEQAQANRAYVRRLLWEKQPEFALALESVAREWFQTCRSDTSGEIPGDYRHPHNAIQRFIALREP